MVENERLGAVAESSGDLKQSINFYETAAEYAKTLYYYTEVRYPPPHPDLPYLGISCNFKVLYVIEAVGPGVARGKKIE